MIEVTNRGVEQAALVIKFGHTSACTRHLTLLTSLFYYLTLQLCCPLIEVRPDKTLPFHLLSNIGSWYLYDSPGGNRGSPARIPEACFGLLATCPAIQG